MMNWAALRRGALVPLIAAGLAARGAGAERFRLASMGPEPRRTQHAHIPMAFTADDKYLFVGHGDQIQIWQTRGRVIVARGRAASLIRYLDISPDDQWCATADRDGRISIWKIEQHAEGLRVDQPRVVAEGPPERPSVERELEWPACMAFSDDGKRFALRRFLWHQTKLVGQRVVVLQLPELTEVTAFEQRDVPPGTRVGPIAFLPGTDTLLSLEARNGRRHMEQLVRRWPIKPDSKAVAATVVVFRDQPGNPAQRNTAFSGFACRTNLVVARDHRGTVILTDAGAEASIRIENVPPHAEFRWLRTASQRKILAHTVAGARVPLSGVPAVVGTTIRVMEFGDRHPLCELRHDRAPDPCWVAYPGAVSADGQMVATYGRIVPHGGIRNDDDAIHSERVLFLWVGCRAGGVNAPAKRLSMRPPPQLQPWSVPRAAP